MAEFPLSLVIKAVDRVTAPMRRINERMKAVTKPVRALANSFTALGNEAGVTKLAAAFGNVGKAVRSVFSEVGRLGVRIGALGALAGLTLFRQFKGSADFGDKLGEAASRVGMLASEYASLGYVAQRAGVSEEEFATSMDQANKRMGEMRANTGPIVTFLSRVSPQLLVQLRGTKSNNDALALMFRAMNRLSDPAKRAAFAAQMFGRSGVKMAEMGKYSAEEIEALRSRFRWLRGDMDKLAERAGGFDDVWNDTTHAFLGVRDAIAVELLPSVTALMEELQRLVVKNRAAIATWARKFAAELPGRLRAMVQGFKELRSALAPIYHGVSSIAGALGGVKGVAIAVAAIFAGKLILSIGALTLGMVALGGKLAYVAMMLGAPLLGAISTFVLALRMGTGVMLAFNAALYANPIGVVIAAVAALAAAAYLIYENWEPISKFFSDAWETIVAVFDAGWKKVKPIIDALTLPFRLGGIIGGELGKLLAGAASGAANRPSMSEMDRRRESRVVVDFENMPRGVRVTPVPGGKAALDLSMGYSMVGYE